MDLGGLQTIRLLACSIILSLPGMAGCSASSGTVLSRLDPLTSVTINYSRSPMVFYRDVSGRAAFARNFIHLAPLEVNRAGSYRYFLWLGIWSTMQNARSSLPRAGFDSIVIYADGEPMALEIAGWSANSIGASQPVYVKPVASAAEAYYEVTVDQLRLIAEAQHIRVLSTGSSRASYEPWDDQKSGRIALQELLRASAF